VKTQATKPRDIADRCIWDILFADAANINRDIAMANSMYRCSASQINTDFQQAKFYDKSQSEHRNTKFVLKRGV
jgi:hypothetical protein